MEEFSGSSGQNEPIAPSSQYTKLSDSLRRVAPQHVSCSIFCGGKRCKYEKGSYWSPDSCAIEGIYSNWITEDILAMSRPNSLIIQEFNVLEQLERLGIKSIINLEIPGEHASCSIVPLHSSGFSYDPLTLMENNIYFYNYAWRDYGEASLAFLLDMVKVMAFSTKEGKVGVHCHAGLGRTGVLIACYLVYAMRLRANEAIRLVRSKRLGSIQSRLHILIVQQFEQFLLPNSIIFCNRDLLKDRKIQDFTLSQYLKRQRVILHGQECRSLKVIPKILNVICERLLTLCGRTNVLEVVEDEEPEALPATPDTPLSETGILSMSRASTIPPSSHQSYKSFSNSEVPYKTDDVVKAFLCDHINMSEGLARLVRQYRIDLNSKGQGAWVRLSNERNLYVLTALLLFWLEHLRHALLGSEELTNVVLYAAEHKETLRRIPMESATTLEYLMRFFAHLELTEIELNGILRRLSASLTHRAVYSTSELKIYPGYHSLLLEKGKSRKLSDGTLNKVMMVLEGMVKEYRNDLEKRKETWNGII